MSNGRAIILGICLLGATAIGVAQDLPAQPGPPLDSVPVAVPATSPKYESLPDDPPDLPKPSVYGLAPVFEDGEAEFLPSLERPGLPVGWFANVEMTIVKPHISGGPQSSDLLSSTFANPIQPALAPIDWNVMPRFEVGYREPEGHGEWRAAYRFVVAQGHEALPNFDAGGGGFVGTRLQVHTLDLDRAFSEYTEQNLPIIPPSFRLIGGVRVAGVSYSTQVLGTQILDQHARNNFVGAGPRFGMEMAWPIGQSSVSFFTKAEGSGVIGPNRQRFAQTVLNPDGTLTSASARSDSTVIGIPIIGVQAGFSWVPELRDGSLRFSAGYLYERWFYLGQNSDSQSELTLQGPFVRGEIHF